MPTAIVAGCLFYPWVQAQQQELCPTSVRVLPLAEGAGLEQVQRFDQAGNLLATYSLEGLATLDVLDMAVSADGRTLYIVDAASKRLQVITLTDDDSAGEEE